jgi:azurin
MKLLTTAIFAGMLAFGTAACAKEEPKKPTATTPAAPAAPAKADTPKTKKVCVDQQGKDGKPVMDAKTKKPKQNCKEVKVREKHEGTAVPEKKK